MMISTETIDRAFEAFHRRYAEKTTQAWDLDHHGQLWAMARADVESQNENGGFAKTLANLRSYWRIARGKGSKMMESDDVLPLLREKAANGVGRHLSDILEADAGWLFQLVTDVSDIKRVNGKPSLMAISKVLHFYNPRLFVIVDRAMVWDWAFMHGWLWNPIETIRNRLDKSLACDAEDRDDAACDLISYVAVLIACGELLRANPEIAQRFDLFLRRRTTDKANLPNDVKTYEAAAVEWLLLGLVELPPVGVSL